MTDPVEIVSPYMCHLVKCGHSKSNDTSAYINYCVRGGTQTCALAVANIAHAVYLLDVAKRPIPQG